MITFFTIPKNNINKYIKSIQTKAIDSWVCLDEKVEVILFTNDQSFKSLYYNSKSIKIFDNLNLSEYGTPFLHSCFKIAKKNSTNSILCYVNCDIIFDRSVFLSKDIFTKYKNALCVGRRRDLSRETTRLIQRKNISNISNYLKENSILHPPTGSDYFIFLKDTKFDLPPLLVGRQFWDLWMFEFFNLYYGFKVFDCTYLINAYHQYHDYSHTTDEIFKTESEFNLKFLKLPFHRLILFNKFFYFFDKNGSLKRNYKNLFFLLINKILANYFYKKLTLFFNTILDFFRKKLKPLKRS